LPACKYRTLRAAVPLVREDGDDAAESPEDSFFDQSRLIRDIRKFTGVMPGRRKKQPETLTKEGQVRRRNLAGKVSKIISDT